MIRIHSVPGFQNPTYAAGTRKRQAMAKSPKVKAPHFTEQARVVLPGSEKAPAENAVHVKATPPKAQLTVSLIVKRKEPLKINKRSGRANGPVRLSMDDGRQDLEEEITQSRRLG